MTLRGALLAVVLASAALLASCSATEPPASMSGEEAGTTAAAAPSAAMPPSTSPSSDSPRGVPTARGERITQARKEDSYPLPKPPAESPELADMRKPYTDLGPVESRYFSAKFLRTDSIVDTMRKRDFDGEVSKLQNEADGESLQRAREYTIQLQESLSPYASQARLGRISCGRHLCMGSLRTGDMAWLVPWRATLDRLPLRMPSISFNVIRHQPNDLEVRFIFTTSGIGGFHSGR